MEPVIIAHWNTERSHNLKDILCVNGKVKERPYSIRLVGVEGDALEFAFKMDESNDVTLTKYVNLDRIEKETDEEALVRLAHAASKKQGKTYDKLDRVLYPCTVADFAVIALVLLPIFSYAYRPFLHVLFPSWLPLIGRLGNFLDNDKILLAVIILEFAIHIAEVVFVLWPLLYHYRITESPDLLTEFLFYGILEGYGPIRRMKELKLE
ncbi:uncharacterized protein RNJ42_00943 [Nakaseomyces bracarensis]|uniref:uncharacterized protein n=1 Tax=Nakaseomyces bracarensis TaxID=273131 RepID=UPI0038712FD6